MPSIAGGTGNRKEGGVMDIVPKEAGRNAGVETSPGNHSGGVSVSLLPDPRGALQAIRVHSLRITLAGYDCQVDVYLRGFQLETNVFYPPDSVDREELEKFCEWAERQIELGHDKCPWAPEQFITRYIQPGRMIEETVEIPDLPIWNRFTDAICERYQGGESVDAEVL